jgi:hypothetical protein
MAVSSLGPMFKMFPIIFIQQFCLTCGEYYKTFYNRKGKLVRLALPAYPNNGSPLGKATARCPDTQHNETQHNDTQHNDTQHEGLISDIQHNDM